MQADYKQHSCLPHPPPPPASSSPLAEWLQLVSLLRVPKVKSKCQLIWVLTWRLWRSIGFQNHSCWQNWVPHGCRTEVPFPCWLPVGSCSQLLGAIHIPWFLVSLLFKPAVAVQLLLMLQISLPIPSASSPASSQSKFSALKRSCDQIGCTYVIQDTFPILRSVALITSSKSLLPCDITQSQFPRIKESWTSLGRTFCPPCANEHSITFWNEANLLDFFQLTWDGMSRPIFATDCMRLAGSPPTFQSQRYVTEQLVELFRLSIYLSGRESNCMPWFSQHPKWTGITLRSYGGDLATQKSEPNSLPPTTI